MPKVTIDHKTDLNASDAFTKIKKFFETDMDIRRFDPSVQCQFVDSKMTGTANGSQFKAQIAVSSAGTGSNISVVVDLPLLLTPFKNKVQEMIQSKLGKYLA